MPSAFLPDRSHFAISGHDADAFLQNLITTDIEGLAAGNAAPGALLTPQGKIMFFFMVSRAADGGFFIETPSDGADALTKRLTMYKMRAKVEIGAPEAVGTSLYWDEAAPEGANNDIRFEKAGRSLFRAKGQGGSGDLAEYDALRVDAAVLEPAADFALGEVFPHDVLLDKNGGVSFKKGCYVGQEVVSRMQHRSTARRRPVKVEAENALPPAETPITIDGKPIGALGTVAGKAGLAIVRIDKAGAAIAAGSPIQADDVTVRLSLPEWTGLSFPQVEDGE
ncbi:folate-binding protein YgfZ [Rhizobium sp. L1K21]|uniref:CAF17-like 4Fe-4S cluster assembly/insertion protein YgfZ n=1 Tax=Rhizobium sp. L1K21 TaxID=2954933 RepID=UPI002093810B|nr:folate-binding protein YgfZ [Rhizobium sp. L1K21]MCO6186576.1 folate-binding protein YgfZ [Rhizobium sp. L1K21]